MPHLARRLVGAPHARVVPVAALLGAPFLLIPIRRLHAGGQA
ncbi:hypothetical protein [Actinoplanes sp. M2I2]|nr:hypothetical protein [Actinoplanes sp. M2I2]